MTDFETKISSLSSAEELAERGAFAELFAASPIPSDEVLSNLPLFLKRQDLARVLFLHELYRSILGVHGVVMEFGVRWGRDLALFQSFRGMYEPFNYTRRVIGFDTFEGYPSVDAKDGSATAIERGAYDVTEGYESYLEQVLAYHERESPVAHIQKFELVKGDATQTIGNYLDEHPETIIALAHFDFDLYEPTRACLEAIRPHITRGTVIGFGSLNYAEFPGETVGLKEALGLDRFAIRRFPGVSLLSYLVVE